MKNYKAPMLPLPQELETKKVFRQAMLAHRKLAELKGVVQIIPNETILINTLVLQEAMDSSAVENIVTTHDELFRAHIDYTHFAITSSTKEVLNYSDALKYGFEKIRNKTPLTNNLIKEMQAMLEENNAGFRSLPGTNLKRGDGSVIYTPPQSKLEIEDYMANLEKFINDDEVSDLDPLVKMAVIHHQFESIHPFYDGNGRTGRIINILYLVTQRLLDLPILYLSRYVIQHKLEYYNLLQKVRDTGEWEEWLLYMLKGVEKTAEDTIVLVKKIAELMQQFKQTLRPLFGRSYRHDLLNNLFSHPYTKIEFVAENLQVTRQTASQYLDIVVEAGLAKKVKRWKTNYYLNMSLIELFIGETKIQEMSDEEIIESITDNFSYV